MQRNTWSETFFWKIWTCFLLFQTYIGECFDFWKPLFCTVVKLRLRIQSIIIIIVVNKIQLSHLFFGDLGENLSDSARNFQARLLKPHSTCTEDQSEQYHISWGNVVSHIFLGLRAEHDLTFDDILTALLPKLHFTSTEHIFEICSDHFSTLSTISGY